MITAGFPITADAIPAATAAAEPYKLLGSVVATDVPAVNNAAELGAVVASTRPKE